MAITAGNVKFIDSLNFLPMPLSAMPKAFGEDELCKGYFPHMFNKAENWDYVGPFPEADQYCASEMKPAAKQTFYTWYNNNKDTVIKYMKFLIIILFKFNL